MEAVEAVETTETVEPIVVEAPRTWVRFGYRDSSLEHRNDYEGHAHFVLDEDHVGTFGPLRSRPTACGLNALVTSIVTLDPEDTICPNCLDSEAHEVKLDEARILSNAAWEKREAAAETPETDLSI